MQPKRPQNAYFFFALQRIPELKKELGIEHKDAMIRAGKLWQEMSLDQKAPYDNMAKEDRKR